MSQHETTSPLLSHEAWTFEGPAAERLRVVRAGTPFEAPFEPVSAWRAASLLRAWLRDPVSSRRLAAKLLRLFGKYTLLNNSKVPAQFKHSHYENDIGGVWPMADYLSANGECQAMVRFAYAVMLQVGCHVTVEAQVVWADVEEVVQVAVQKGALVAQGVGPTKFEGNFRNYPTRALPVPLCSSRQAWAAVAKRGVPAGAVAKMSYAADRDGHGRRISAGRWEVSVAAYERLRLAPEHNGVTFRLAPDTCKIERVVPVRGYGQGEAR